MKYVVTGAAGFIGSHLAEALQREGHEVLGVDCFTDYYDPAVKERNARGLDVRRLDLARDELDFTAWDGVFHLAGQPGVRSFGDVFPLYVERNVLASQRVFDAAVAAGTRVVFASSSSVYGEAERYPTPEETPPRPLSPYGITKLACEHLARASGRSFGLDAVVLRYFNAYGPRQRPDMAFTRLLDRHGALEHTEIAMPGNERRKKQILAVREAAQVMRIWIAEWTDKNDDLHYPGYLFTEIQPRRWSVGKSEASGRNTTVPFRAAAAPAGASGKEQPVAAKPAEGEARQSAAMSMPGLPSPSDINLN